MDELNSLETNFGGASITCPNCHNQFSYYDRRKSTFFGCRQCGTFFERSSDGRVTLRTFSEADRDQPPLFPFGTKGYVDGKEYTFVGFITKKQADDDVYWNEYLFYAPNEQWYLILSEYDGHWLIINRSHNQNINKNHASGGRNFAYDEGRPYELYMCYKFIVVDAGGEFDWNILDDEELITYEYVAAPVVLVNEERNNRDSWFHARYISPKEITQLFEVDPALFPDRIGFNPTTFYPRWQPMIKFTGLLLALLLLIHLVLFVAKPNKSLYSGSFICEPDTTSWGACKPVITPSFDIKGPAAVSVDMLCDVLDNNWIELPMVLVNDGDGRAYEINKTISYYHGYDDGDSWSEGGRSQDATLSRVPSGTYHLNIYPGTETPQASAGLSVAIKVTQNVFLARNFWLLLVLITIYPLIQFIRKYNFENSKWFAKDYGTLKKD
jgi:ribosomal protein S27E